MDTLWLPVSNLRLWDWRVWKPYHDLLPKLSAWLGVGDIFRVSVSFELNQGRVCLYNSLSEIGDRPIDYKLDGAEVPDLRLNEAVHEALGWAFERGLREDIADAFAAETLPKQWSWSPWEGRSLWIPFGAADITAKAVLTGGLFLAGSISFDRFLRYADVELASVTPNVMVMPGIRNGVADDLVMSKQLSLWLVKVFSQSQFIDFALDADPSWRGEKTFSFKADDYEALRPIHLGFSPPVQITSSV